MKFLIYSMELSPLFGDVFIVTYGSADAVNRYGLFFCVSSPVRTSVFMSAFALNVTTIFLFFSDIAVISRLCASFLISATSSNV